MAGRLPVFVCAAATLTAAIGMSARASTTNGRPVAKAARRVQLVETAKLKFHGEKGAAVVDYGEASGTYDAPLKAEMTLHGTYVSAVVTIYPHGGTIIGTAHADFKPVNEILYFGGTFKLSHGTGKFRNISEIKGKPLGISGTLNQNNDNGEVKAHGEANE
jgi:hypothetical protein